MKNWSGFYPETIKSQFIKDLVNTKELGNIQWIFHKTGNTTNLKNLKENVMKALKKADGTPIEDLNSMTLEQVRKLFPESSTLITPKNKIDFLLEKLNENQVFNKIFQISE